MHIIVGWPICFWQVLLLLEVIPTSLAVQLFPSVGAVPSAIPAACATALVANISCPELVSASYISAQRSLSTCTLNGLCNSNCSNSLLAFQQQVNAQCGTISYAFTGSTSQTVQQIVDPLVWAYNVSCLTDGQTFCYPQATNASYNSSLCSTCVLKYEAAMLNSEYGRVRINPNSFTSQLSSCGIPASSYSFTNPVTTTPTNTSSSSAPTATCSGTSYTVQTGDCCHSIAQSHGIATDKFITQNYLDYNCTTLTVGNSVCLGDTCSLYTIKANDTCNGILSNQTFYLTQLLSWNPTIHTTCDNLGAMVGRSICISPPGSTSWDAVPQNTTVSWDVTFVLPSTNFSTIAIQTAASNYTTSWFVPTTTLDISTTTVTVDLSIASAVATRMSYCPITDSDFSAGWTEADLPDDCTALIDPYCNPNINAPILPSTTFPVSCSPAYYYGTSESSTTGSTASSTTTTGAPTQTGIISTCNAFYTVVSGDSCQGIVDKFGNFSISQFYSWNPAVGSSCQYLYLGYAVCVGVPGSSATSSTSTFSTAAPTQTGIISTCNNYYTVVSGDTCSGIVSIFGTFTLTQFYSWNPAIGTSCQNLYLGYGVCVGVSGSSSPSSTTSSSATAPSPLEPSTIPSCKTYYQVVSGDSCAAIEAANGITADQFNTWNPYVGTDCASLWLGYYVCVSA